MVAGCRMPLSLFTLQASDNEPLPFCPLWLHFIAPCYVLHLALQRIASVHGPA